MRITRRRTKLGDLPWPNSPGASARFQPFRTQLTPGVHGAPTSQHCQGLQRKRLASVATTHCVLASWGNRGNFTKSHRVILSIMTSDDLSSSLLLTLQCCGVLFKLFPISPALPLLPHVTMAAPLDPVSDPGTEVSLLELNQELQSKLEASQQDFRDLREKFLVSEATAYSLANQLQKYKCEELKDIIESMLGQTLQCKQGNLAETLTEKLRQYHILIKAQAAELTQLWQKLREGREVSEPVDQHLKDLLTHDDPERSQGQAFQEEVAEGRRLAECLARQLSPEDEEEEEEEEEDEQAEESLTTSMELPEAEKKEVLQDTLNECVLTPSIGQEGRDCYQPYRDGTFPSDKQEFGSALDVACECSHCKGDETPPGSPDNQIGHEGLKGRESDAPRSTAIFFPEELEVSSALEMAKNQTHQEEEQDQDLTCARFGRELQENAEQDVQQDSLDERYLTYSALPDPSDSPWTHRRANINSYEDLDVCPALEAANNHNDLCDEEDQDPTCPSNTRLCRELPVAPEDEVPQDSVGECNLTPSVGHDLSDTYRPYRSASFTSDQQEVFVGVDVDAPMQVPGPQGPSSGNLTFPRTEVQASQAPPQSDTQVANSVPGQPDQQLACGDRRARLRISPAIRRLAATMVSGSQRPLFQEQGLEASMGVKNPPKLEGDAAEGSVANQCAGQVFGHVNALGVMKQKMIKRKVQFGEGRLACRFRGLQA
ncbi:neuroblastoma breakpoint family member 6-like isoform X2 [Felis catus]|uniref:neuroblastoma breakpoint family member 6-like isoform X2 n=1 Tax=Felis catus TaxID=9685 RepID=UPI001D19A84D|nr:neuroblastoma breakpoint family member 6-like isoform X2 [Felis catus]XP_044889313.1 neuroblastoma breakpoint family member 6-like isoform X2 [Felis catus]